MFMTVTRTESSLFLLLIEASQRASDLLARADISRLSGWLGRAPRRFRRPREGAGGELGVPRDKRLG